MLGTYLYKCASLLGDHGDLANFTILVEMVAKVLLAYGIGLALVTETSNVQCGDERVLGRI